MRRQGSMEKTIILRKPEGSRKRGRPTVRWSDSKKKKKRKKRSHRHVVLELSSDGYNVWGTVDITHS